MARALSSISDSQTDSVQPGPIQLSASKAVALILITVDMFNPNTESERRFVQVATDCNWTQSETQEVLKVLKDEGFHLEDVHPDLIRLVFCFRN